MNHEWISDTDIFRGITAEETESMMNCLQSRSQTYAKGETIFRTGDCISSMGLVLLGGVNIIQTDVWGNQNIIDHIGPGQIFAETYACAPGEPLMVDAVSSPESEILFLNIEKVLKTCPEACGFHSRLIRNLLTVTASKNLNLTRKISHITPKTIRGRLLAYLSHQAVRQGIEAVPGLPQSRSCRQLRPGSSGADREPSAPPSGAGAQSAPAYTFEIPFNRQQLADYLCVDRSALSNELCKLRDEGLLSFEKNRFSLHTGPDIPR